MGVLYVLALIAAVLPRRAFDGPWNALSSAAYKHPAAAYAAGATLVVSSSAYTFLFERAIAAHPLPAAMTPAPLLFIDPWARTTLPQAITDRLLACVVAQTIALAILIWQATALASRARTALVAVTSCALAVGAITAWAVDTPDVYAYAGLATLGASAYAPPPVPFAGDLHPINAIWGTPMTPSVYGPLWIAISALVLHGLPSLAAKVFALKALGLASVLGCALLVRRLGASQAIVTGVACNPALYLTYVSNARNDLCGVDLVLLAMLCAARMPALAFAFALGACLIKLTLLPVVIIATAVSLRTRTSRALFACGLVALLGVIYLAGGGVMLAAAISVSHEFASASPASGTGAMRTLLIACIAASTLWTVARGRSRPQIAWTPPALGATPLANYLIWGLPLALGSTPVALAYLVTWPLLAFAQSAVLPDTPALDLTLGTLVFIAIAILAYRFRPQRSLKDRLA